MAVHIVYKTAVFSVALSETWKGCRHKKDGGRPRWTVFVNLRQAGGSITVDLHQLRTVADQLEIASKIAEQKPPFEPFGVVVPNTGSSSKPIRIYVDNYNMVFAGPAGKGREFSASQAKTLAGKLRDAYKLAKNHGYTGIEQAHAFDLQDPTKPVADDGQHCFLGRFDRFNVHVEADGEKASDCRLVFRNVNGQEPEWSIPIGRLDYLEGVLRLNQVMGFAGRVGVKCSTFFRHKFEDDSVRLGLLGLVRSLMKNSGSEPVHGKVIGVLGGEIVVSEKDDRVHFSDDKVGKELSVPMQSIGEVLWFVERSLPVALNNRLGIWGSENFRIHRVYLSELKKMFGDVSRPEGVVPVGQVPNMRVERTGKWVVLSDDLKRRKVQFLPEELQYVTSFIDRQLAIQPNYNRQVYGNRGVFVPAIYAPALKQLLAKACEPAVEFTL